LSPAISRSVTFGSNYLPQTEVLPEGRLASQAASSAAVINVFLPTFLIARRPRFTSSYNVVKPMLLRLQNSAQVNAFFSIATLPLMRLYESLAANPHISRGGNSDAVTAMIDQRHWRMPYVVVVARSAR
jgi:hypothetical protein